LGLRAPKKSSAIVIGLFPSEMLNDRMDEFAIIVVFLSKKMYTTSFAVGTVEVFQLLASFQSPLFGFVQDTTAPCDHPKARINSDPKMT